ncbi:MAG TPA: ribokinase [Terriglobia bacterium]|nr:ribokinase [Terriglobia bacterium]
MKRKHILVVGSINLDLVVSVRRIPERGETVAGADFQIFFGGKGANQAVGAARLGHPVRMIGRVGDDEFGSRLRAGLRTAAVRTASVKVTAGTSSGVALITVDARGHNTIVVTPGANGKLTPEDLEAGVAEISSAGIILAQLETPLETVERLASLASRCNVPLILDPAPARKLSRNLLRQVTWLTPNETEASVLCGENVGRIQPSNAKRYARQLMSKGPRNVLLKLGNHGAYIATAEGASVRIPAYKVPAVDSTAAGDALNAGFAVALMSGMDATAAARYASSVAALSVTRLGAQPSMPTAAEVSRFLANQETRL